MLYDLQVRYIKLLKSGKTEEAKLVKQLIERLVK